jgi:hypothetical protein
MGYPIFRHLQTPFEVSLFIALCRVRKSLYRPETRREHSALDCLIVLKGLGPAKFVLPALLIHVRKEIRKRYGFLYNGFEPGTYVQLLYYFRPWPTIAGHCRPLLAIAGQCWPLPTIGVCLRVSSKISKSFRIRG